MAAPTTMAAPSRNSIFLKLSQILGLLLTYCQVQILLSACQKQDGFDGFLLCRKCGFEVAKAEDLISVPSSKALRQRNDSLVGSQLVLIQLFRNPQEMLFEVITSSDAQVEKSSEKYAADSWFPGFAWSIAYCPKCGAHVGWSFDAITGTVNELKSKLSTFTGFIMDKIMHDEDVMNLIAVPKVYNS